MGIGRDLDDAVLAATNKSIAQEQGLVTLVSLSFSCANLPNLDTFTRTDGFVVLYHKQGTVWRKLGHTEIIMDSLEPKWVKSFEVQYFFEKREFYKAVVYDVDDFNNVDNYAGHDLVGEIEFGLHDVVTARDQSLTRPLECAERPPGRSGTITITAEEKKGKNNEECSFALRGDFSDSSGMNFFIIHKWIGHRLFKPIYKSEITEILNGTFNWNFISLLTSELANEEAEQEIRIEFFRNNKNGKHTNLGFITFTLAQLKEGTTEYELQALKGGKGQKISF